MSENLPEYPYPLTDEHGNCICQLCGKSSKTMTPQHLTKLHNIDMKTYRARFPQAVLVSQQTKDRHKDAQLERFMKITKPEVEDQAIRIQDYDIITDSEDNSKSKNDNIYKQKLDEEVNKVLNPIQTQSLTNTPQFETIPDRSIEKFRNIKIGIINKVKELLPNIQVNGLVRKITGGGHLVFEFITDFADPILKVIVDFPDSFWHNSDTYTDPNKDTKLKNAGWKIIKVLKHEDPYTKVKDSLFNK